MSHPLDNAYARISRAKEHLTHLERESLTILSPITPWTENAKGIVLPASPIEKSVTLLPPIFGIVAGESIYNLRASLDYLVYELAILDSGSTQKGTQFPIESTVKGWNGRLNTFLKGLSVKHKTIIEGLQPCNGCKWTETLRDISNPDKHRTLQVVRISSFKKKANIPASAVSAVKMHAQFTPVIAFDDGSPVIETLQELKTNVTTVLDKFNSDF